MELPLIQDLLTEPLAAGSSLLVEYDPESLWYAASLTIAAGWLKTGGRVTYLVYSQPPDNIRSKLKRLGLDVQELELNDKLQIWDSYTCQLGQKSQERYAPPSLKVADLSIFWSRELMRRAPEPDNLIITDNSSSLARFNDEKAWVEFLLTRAIPGSSMRKITAIRGIIRGLHSDWVHKNLKAAVDGIIDFKLSEASEERQDLIGIRSMRNVRFDRRWHRLNIGENLEVILQN